jgi:hypothetical protein
MILPSAGTARAQAPAGTGDASPVPVPTSDASAVPARSTPDPPRGRPAVPVDRVRAVAPLPALAREKPKPGRCARAWKVLRKLADNEVFRLELVGYFKYTYGYGKSAAGQSDITFSDFRVTRAYLGAKVKPTRWFEARITVDTTQDDTGDFKMRLKYLYGKFTLPLETSLVTEPYVMAGMVSTPWHSFEEGLNAYRMQGTIFAERNKLFGSTDLGVTFGTLLGRKLPARYQKEVSPNDPGSIGSLALGVYNGGGYAAKELNPDKEFALRLALRPALHWHPNLQVAYGLIWGRGNVDSTLPEYAAVLPAWRNHLFQASYEHRYFVTYVQYAFGTGSQKADPSWLHEDFTARPFRGTTAFLEVKLPWIRSSVMGRHDYFDGPNASGKPYHRVIAGYALHFWGRNKNVLLLDYERSLYTDARDPWALSLTIQLKL